MHKRFSSEAENFLRKCLQWLLQETLLPLKETFCELIFCRRILICDSSQWQIDPKLASCFKGSGGSASAAVCKLQLIIIPQSGKIARCEAIAGTIPDQRYCREIPSVILPGDLILFDLGYYSVETFQRIQQANAFFLTRIYYNVTVKSISARKSSSLAALLRSAKTDLIDLDLIIGSRKSMALRLIASKLPAEKANSLRRKLREDYRRTRGGEPPQERLQFCDWTVVICNISRQSLPAKKAISLYGTRWQIEIFFRDLKSVLDLDFSSTSKLHRFQCELLAKLILAVLSFSIYGRFNLYHCQFHQCEISFNKLLKRLRQSAGHIHYLIRKQSKKSYTKLRAVILKLLDFSIKYHQNNRKTPLQLISECVLS